jgi:hypothetical protein
LPKKEVFWSGQLYSSANIHKKADAARVHSFYYLFLEFCMNASAVQNVNLAPLSVEEMENTNGGFIFIAVLVLAACCSGCASSQVVTRPRQADTTGRHP